MEPLRHRPVDEEKTGDERCDDHPDREDEEPPAAVDGVGDELDEDADREQGEARDRAPTPAAPPGGGSPTAGRLVPAPRSSSGRASAARPGARDLDREPDDEDDVHRPQSPRAVGRSRAGRHHPGRTRPSNDGPRYPRAQRGSYDAPRIQITPCSSTYPTVP